MEIQHKLTRMYFAAVILDVTFRGSGDVSLWKP